MKKSNNSKILVSNLAQKMILTRNGNKMNVFTNETY